MVPVIDLSGDPARVVTLTSMHDTGGTTPGGSSSSGAASSSSSSSGGSGGGGGGGAFGLFSLLPLGVAALRRRRQR